MEFDLENPLTSFKEHQTDTIPSLFADESHHMPSLSSKANDYFVSLRRKAIFLILQAQFSCNFDPYISYLAVNYMDRFISKQEFPQQEKPWILRLLVISCLSLAAKMKNIDLSLSHLQGDKGLIYNTRSIHRMEVLILTTLKWQMRSITPFSFMYFFLSLFEIKDLVSTRALKERASEILFKSHSKIKLLEYKPSIIAASALLCASHEMFPLQFPCFRYEISSCGYVDKENLLNCSRVMQEIIRKWNESTVHATSSTSTSVVDRHHSTNTSSEDNESSAIIHERDINDVKRRKMNKFCNNQMFQFSQIQPC